MDEATGFPGRFDYMFAEGGDPCFEHNGNGMCVYAVGELYGSSCNEQGCTLWTGACDLNAAECMAGGASCDRQESNSIAVYVINLDILLIFIAV